MKFDADIYISLWMTFPLTQQSFFIWQVLWVMVKLAQSIVLCFSVTSVDIMVIVVFVD